MIGKTMKVIFIVFCVFLVSLFFWRVTIPKSLVDALCGRCSSGRIVVSCGRVTFGFREGLVFENLRVYDTARKRALEPVASVGTAAILPFRKRLVLTNLSYPRLPDSYYEPTPTTPLSPDVAGALAALELPRFSGLTLELVGGCVVGVCPKRLLANVSCDGRRVDFTGVHIDWPSEENAMSVDGTCTVDFGRMRVDGFASGTATQPLIRPLLVAIDIPASYPYFDAFTGVVGPVQAYCAWGVDLRTSDTTIDLDLTPHMGRYNGVPLKSATGKLAFGITFPNRRMCFTHVIGPIHASDRAGGNLDGSIGIVKTNDVLSLDFDATSSLTKDDILDIVDYLNHGELDALKCETQPRVTAKGLLYPYRQPMNDLSGSVAFEKGTLFGIPLRDASARYSYVGDTVSFSEAFATGKRGGNISGSARLVLPIEDPLRRSFEIDLTYRDGRAEELVDLLPMDLGDRRGIVDAKVRLSAPLGTNALARLNGSGEISVREGHIAQMKLFAGWTQMMTEYVPGMPAIVNQSQGHGTFTIRDGVLTTHDAVIDGSALLAIYLDGSYDMVHDRLDAYVKVRLLKDDSLLGKFLIRPVTWPFARLLMEFRLKGKIDNPEWTAIPLLKED